MTKLSVNINKVATIRNARGGNTPNVLNVALDCERFGAEGITVHPRPDQRHIRFQDVEDLSQNVKTEFNIEGYPSPDFIKMVLDAKPAQVTLVPDPPEVLTSNAGWDTIAHQGVLQDVVGQFKENGIRTSIFMETDFKLLEVAKSTGTDRVELYTEDYATQYPLDKAKAIAPYKEASKFIETLGLGLNAGHDLSLENLQYFTREMHSLLEVSIGHALISDALYFGLENTIQMYLREIKLGSE